MAQIFVTIDRFEGEKAVIILDDTQTLVVAKKVLPQNSKEGDIIELNFSVSHSQTTAVRNSAAKLLKKIINRQGHENT